MFLKISQKSRESTCAGVTFSLSYRPGLQKYSKETPAQAFFREFCTILKNAPGRLFLTIKHLPQGKLRVKTQTQYLKNESQSADDKGRFFSV